MISVRMSDQLALKYFLDPTNVVNVKGNAAKSYESGPGNLLNVLKSQILWVILDLSALPFERKSRITIWRACAV